MRNLFVAFFILISHVVCAQEEGAAKVELPEGFTAKIDVVYTKVGDWDGRMDMYLPPKGNKPSPVIINIHGGAWVRGTKESQGGFNTFFKLGFAVANVEYRLAGKAKAPAAIEDVRCALIYLIRNARELNIDVNRIVVMGGSAGGHLALMAGLLGNNPLFDKNCPEKSSIKVAAIIDKYGVVDLTPFVSGEKQNKSGLLWLDGKASDLDFLKSISPISYVTKNSPPVFIVHGDADPVVPYAQSVALRKKLDEVGVKNKFITIEGGGHGKFTKEKNSEVMAAIADFLKSVMDLSK